MALIPISMPFIREESGSNHPTVQKDALPEAGSSSWLKGTLVYTSGTGASTVLNKLATAGTVIYGQSPDVSHTSGTGNWPDAPFGLNHYPFDLRDRILEINISGSQGTIGTTSGATWAGGGTNGVALAPGQQYGVLTPTSGVYQNYQLLDVSNTTQKVFEIVALAPGGPNLGGTSFSSTQSVNDNNPRVWVKVIPGVLQG